MSDCNANLLFEVTVDTSPLIGNAAGPFYLDFQLVDGSGTGDANNKVIIRNFTFGDNTFHTSLSSIGGGSGSLLSFVTITDSEFLNEFTDQFDPGNTLSFRVNLTTNLDAGPTPDAFSFAILDSTFAPLPTIGLGDALLLVNINSDKPLIETFPTSEGSPVQLSAPQVTVPETGSSNLMLLIGLGAIWGLRRRFLYLA